MKCNVDEIGMIPEDRRTRSKFAYLAFSNGRREVLTLQDCRDVSLTLEGLVEDAGESMDSPIEELIADVARCKGTGAGDRQQD